jgi:hypothetical protein
VVGTEVGSREGNCVGVWVGLMLGAWSIDREGMGTSERSLAYITAEFPRVLSHPWGPG